MTETPGSKPTEPAAGPEFPGVNRVTKKSGKVYYYHRATGKTLGTEYGSPDFVRAYEEAERVRLVGTAPPPPPDKEPIWRTIWNRYEASPEFQGLAPKTQETERRYILRIQDEWGWMVRADIEAPEIMGDIYELRDEIAGSGRVRTADAYIALISKLVKFARRRAIISRNHLAEEGGVERLYRKNQRADIIHTDEQRAAILEAAERIDHGIRDAYLVALYTAARWGDMIAWPERAFDGQWLTWKPSKTAKKTAVTVSLPVYALKPLAEAMARLPKGSGHLLARPLPNGPQPWHRSTFRDRWAAVRTAAALGDADLHWHDLRGTLVTMLAEAGCTDSEIASVTGHSMGSGTSLGAYMKRSRELALSAYMKLSRHLEQPADRGKVVPFSR